MSILYYTGILTLLFFFSKKETTWWLLALTIFIIHTEDLLYSGIINNGGGYYSSSVITEFIACFILLSTYKLHRSLKLIIPFLLAILLNLIFLYQYQYIPLRYEDTLYWYANTILYEVIILICMNETSFINSITLLYKRISTQIAALSVKLYLRRYYKHTETHYDRNNNNLIRKPPPWWSGWHDR